MARRILPILTLCLCLFASAALAGEPERYCDDSGRCWTVDEMRAAPPEVVLAWISFLQEKGRRFLEARAKAEACSPWLFGHLPELLFSDATPAAVSQAVEAACAKAWAERDAQPEKPSAQR